MIALDFQIWESLEQSFIAIRPSDIPGRSMEDISRIDGLRQ
jgi:hypothetical protein